MKSSRWKRACRLSTRRAILPARIYAGLGVTGKTPTQDDLAAIETWHEQGANDELILLAVKAAHGQIRRRQHG